MGNPDLIIVFNNGEFVFLIAGNKYNTREEAISISFTKRRLQIGKIYEEADKPEELSFEIKSINIYEIREQQ
ncbi:MAG: hypothetical protein ACYDIA_01875 [Candidatus Humimicrobiaceae bacterium]